MEKNNNGVNMNNPLFITEKYENENEYIKSLINKSNKTLPCLIIKEIYERKSSLNINEIIDIISIHYNDLRKPTGGKYGNNIKRVLSSTLHSTGLFIKKQNNSYELNKKNVILYLERNSNGKIRKKLNENYTNNNDKFINKKRIIEKSLNNNNNNDTKFVHCYEILDDILSKYSNDKKISKHLTNPLTKCNSSDEFLIKIGNSDKLIGMLSCFKLFRPFLKKIFVVKRKFNKKTYKIDENLLSYKQKFEYLQEVLDSNIH